MVQTNEDAPTIRLYFQNVEGLKLSQGDADTILMSKFLRDNDVSIFGFVETNTEWLNYSIKQRVYKNFKKLWASMKWATSTSATMFPGIHKPGGTCTVASGRLASHVSSINSDKQLGR